MSPVHTPKNPEQKKSESLGSSENEGYTNSVPSFKDNRTESIVQKKVQENADKSSQVIENKTIQQMANKSSFVQKDASMQSLVNNSNYMVAQKKSITSISDSLTLQRKQSEEFPETNTNSKTLLQKRENKTGMPDSLKSGIESLSGMDMSDVQVHYNSNKPAQLKALAFAQDTDIHLSPGQEKHLPHEAWHVVQQKQGIVKPSLQMKGININDDEQLEKEADEMGAKANNNNSGSAIIPFQLKSEIPEKTVQRKVFVGSKDSPKKIEKIPKELKDKESGDKKMDTMVSDGIDRHFLDQQELENYMGNATETIGVVDKEQTWVRLIEGQLTVLGEAHTQTVLSDIAKAVNTSRFVYEPYNEIPKDLKSAESIQTSDNSKWQSQAGMGSNDKTNHTMEFILPKLVFSLEYIKGVILQGKIDKHKKTKDEQYNIAERLAHYLSMAMSIAKDLSIAKKDELEIVSCYKNNKDLIDATILDAGKGTYLGDLVEMNKSTTNQTIIYNFCVAFVDYAIQDFENRKDNESPDQGTIDAVKEIKKENHSKDKKKEPRSTAANTWREFYMYQNVVRAKVLNFLLAGMGDAHRQNLEEKLKKVSGIKVFEMDQFIENNKANNKEVSKNAEANKLTENEYRLMTDEDSGMEEAIAMDNEMKIPFYENKMEDPLDKAALE
jgi:hypothetical protein